MLPVRINNLEYYKNWLFDFPIHLCRVNNQCIPIHSLQVSSTEMTYAKKHNSCCIEQYSKQELSRAIHATVLCFLQLVEIDL